MKFGKVTRPVLGISFAPEQSVEQLGVSGVLVLDAPPNGPAGKAVSSQEGLSLPLFGVCLCSLASIHSRKPEIGILGVMLVLKDLYCGNRD